MHRVMLACTWLSVTGALVGFFLPWAHISLREPELARQVQHAVEGQGLLGDLTEALGRVTVQVRRGAQTITGELPTLSEIPKQVSGVEVPRLANQKNAQVAAALFELLTNTRQRLGAKSYAVYLVPGVALLCGLLLSLLGSRRPVALGIAVVCAGVAGLGFWKLLTTNTQALFAAITIGRGLWLSLWAYAGLAVSALLMMVAGSRR
jgi:hypothetical protein